MDSIYRIPCQQCPKAYIGESGRRLGVRVKEHQKDVNSARSKFTRAQRTSSLSVWNKSALTDHVSQENHVIDWTNTKVVGRESGKARRLIREAIRIRQEPQSIN